MFRLILSIIIGWILGRERKVHDKDGGSRTMALVCMSACLVSIISLDLHPSYNFDLMRLMQGTIQGIGFIGMGLIFKQKGQVEGLTTASLLFSVVILGFCIGLGYFLYSILGSFLIYLLLESKYWNEKVK